MVEIMILEEGEVCVALCVLHRLCYPLLLLSQVITTSVYYNVARLT